MARILAALLALFLVGNGTVMLAAPEAWYQAVPGVTGTGPFNRHFVNDVGGAFLVAGGGLGWAALRPAQGWPAAVAGAAFLALHALIHLAEALGGHGLHAIGRDFNGVYLPALLAVALAFVLKPRIQGDTTC
ncbi:MAG TPA: hypothetical protein VF727_09570 [Allosphingosinicella sp.]|jgi:hypothetical protein